MPFFSGEFDDPNFDDVHNPTGQAGITCTVCHVITAVNNTRGNGAYTIAEPRHYPFAFSDNPVLKWINLTLVKAKPEMHKKEFMKPIIKSAEFCSVCHKVGIPVSASIITRISSGGRTITTPTCFRVFPATVPAAFIILQWRSRTAMNATWTCWPPATSVPGTSTARGDRQIHNHLFPGANTALPIFQETKLPAAGARAGS